MGYMGTGLQKWIYTMKPRRPFSRDRKPVGDTIQSHEYDSCFEELPLSKQHVKIKNKKKYLVRVNQRIQIAKKRYKHEFRMKVMQIFVFLFLFYCALLYY